MANRNVNSLLQWDDLEELEITFERNRRLREEEETPLEEEECEFDNAHTENEI